MTLPKIVNLQTFLLGDTPPSRRNTLYFYIYISLYKNTLKHVIQSQERLFAPPDTSEREKTILVHIENFNKIGKGFFVQHEKVDCFNCDSSFAAGEAVRALREWSS